MATENPIRIHETSGKWSSSSANMSTDELRLFLGGTRVENNRGRDFIPGRSESAPPTVEGSLSAIGKIYTSQDLYLKSNSLVAEEQIFGGEQSYLPFYGSNGNLNPRLSPPLTAWRNQQTDHVFNSANGDNWRLSSFSQQSRGSLDFTKNKLHTYREDSEDDRSPHGSSAHEAGTSAGFWPGHVETSSSGQYGSLDGLAQEEFVQTSSPPLTHESTEEAVEYVADFGSMQNASLNSTNTATSSPSGAGINTDMSKGHVLVSMSATNMPFTPTFSSRVSNDTDVISDSDLASMESKMMTMNLSDEQNLGRHAKASWQQSHQSNQLQQLGSQQQRSGFQNAKPQFVVPPAINLTAPGMSQFSHGPPSFASTEQHAILNSSGYVNTPYSPAAMASSSTYYPNMHPSGYFSPQYGVGGYTLNSPTVFPTFMPGYPHGAIPMSFDQNSGVANIGGNLHGVDMQQLGNLYGQFGFTMQPMLSNAFQMQYTELLYRNPYSVPGQLTPLVSPVAGGSRIDSQRKDSEYSAGSNHQNIQYQGELGVLHRRGEGYASHYVNPSSTSLPGSPVPGVGTAGLKNELRFAEGSFKNPGTYSRWQGQRENNNFNTRVHSYLEELKSGRGRRFELSDIAGHIVQFSADQHGSRFIQQKLENCSAEDKASVFKEVLPHASRLIVDVFGNYVIQKFFEYGSTEQRKELADQLASQILSLSLQMYGCRVIQKALDVIELDQKAKLVSELDGHVLTCVHDQNGNHVIQKCIECIPTDKIGFILSAFHGQVETLSMHPYGCRVIQRVLEHCMDQPQSQFIVDEILESVCTLAQNQYGNYVTQHVLQRGDPQERARIISKLLGNVVQMSQHKFASNVVEKCIEHGDISEREMLIQEITGGNDGSDNLLVMMKDQYANYVIQKLLDTCTDSQREMLFSRIHNHVNALKKYTYGKHIVTRFEQLYGEELAEI